jgi:hypothetical protein
LVGLAMQGVHTRQQSVSDDDFGAPTATRHAVDAGLSAARAEHAITHMRGIRPDIVANDTMNASARMLLEAKTAALCPSNYGTRFAANAR